jgi:hypothetical protein
MDQKQKKRVKLIQPKANEKPKMGHLGWANSIPKDMGNDSMQPRRSKLGPQRHGQQLDATKKK